MSLPDILAASPCLPPLSLGKCLLCPCCFDTVQMWIMVFTFRQSVLESIHGCTLLLMRKVTKVVVWRMKISDIGKVWGRVFQMLLDNPKLAPCVRGLKWTFKSWYNSSSLEQGKASSCLIDQYHPNPHTFWYLECLPTHKKWNQTVFFLGWLDSVLFLQAPDLPALCQS